MKADDIVSHVTTRRSGAMDYVSDAIESYNKSYPVLSKADLEAMAGDLRLEFEKEGE